MITVPSWRGRAAAGAAGDAASVTVDGSTVGEIGAGLMVLVGVPTDDTPRDAEKLADMWHLRVMDDDAA